MPFIRPVKKRSGRRPEAGAARILRNPSRAMDCGRRSASCFGTDKRGRFPAAEAPDPGNSTADAFGPAGLRTAFVK